MSVTRKRYLIENLSLSWNKNQNEQKWVKGRLGVGCGVGVTSWSENRF